PKNCIVLVDRLPYRQWYEAHFATPLGRKKGAKLISPFLEEQFLQGKLLDTSSTRKDQRGPRSTMSVKRQPRSASSWKSSSSRESSLLALHPDRASAAGQTATSWKEELEFYLRNIKAKKGK
ncbi:small ribosomal subunit protein eS8-like, partial [Gasterosteus aculeatus]